MLINIDTQNKIKISNPTKKILTLTLIQKNDQILLGLKKRGFGMGKWNGFGGKVEQDETIEETAQREVLEESGLTLKNLEKMAVIDFSWEDNLENLEVHVFRSTDYQGEPQETEEMKPQWYKITEIPYKKMWDDDRYWFGYFLNSKKFVAQFIFDKNDKVIKHQINEMD